MNFFLDNNLPPNWWAVLSACSKGQFVSGVVGEVVHLRGRFPANTPDTAWMAELGKQKNGYLQSEVGTKNYQTIRFVQKLVEMLKQQLIA